MTARESDGNDGFRSDSVNDLSVECLVEALEVRNFQSGDGLDRLDQRFISLAILSEGLSHASQNPKDLRPIEPLTFTMLTEIHSAFLSRLIRGKHRRTVGTRQSHGPQGHHAADAASTPVF
jgi:hypothetical protein